MKLPYAYKSGAFNWYFTNFLSSEATVRHDLEFDVDERRFIGARRQRQDAMSQWRAPTALDAAEVEELRKRLPPEDLAACMAAAISIRRPFDADA